MGHLSAAKSLPRFCHTLRSVQWITPWHSTIFHMDHLHIYRIPTTPTWPAFSIDVTPRSGIWRFLKRHRSWMFTVCQRWCDSEADDMRRRWQATHDMTRVDGFWHHWQFIAGWCSLRFWRWASFDLNSFQAIGIKISFLSLSSNHASAPLLNMPSENGLGHLVKLEAS